MDAAPNSEQEQHAIDRKGEVTEQAARLIAAAPELLAALINCSDYLSEFLEEGRAHRVIKKADQIIAKIERRSHE